MKRCSFEVAKAIAKYGYPQGAKNSGLTDVYPLEDHDDNFVPYTRIGKLTTNYHCRTFSITSDIPFVVAPTYLDVWLWLWREKKISIDVEHLYCNLWDSFVLGMWTSEKYDDIEFNDPEEAIASAIEYLIKNKK